MADTPQVEKLHFTVTGPAGETFGIATYTNGRWGITRDGAPLAGLEWPTEELADCTAALVRLAKLNA